MQRFFSTFPGGWPGLGLVLLRIAAAAPLVIAVSARSSDLADRTSLPLEVVGTASGGLLVMGLWTPLAAALEVLIEIWLVFNSGTLTLNHGTRAVIGLALMMLGPGKYSLDRRLYGRKRIELRR